MQTRFFQPGKKPSMSYANSERAVQVLVVALFMSILGLAGAAHAATRFVDGNGGNNSGNDCLNSASPCATIQFAINSAGAGDVIQIADSIYTETVVIDKALSLRGQSRASTIVQAAAQRGQAADRVISVADDTSLDISDLTVRHGNSDLNGGGIECIGGDLLIERVLFTDNDADGQGAGLASGNNIIVMNDVVFRDNGNSGTSEGGGAFLGENFIETDVTLADVRFENNRAAAAGGLSLFNPQAVLRGVVFTGNTSDQDGGGLFYEGSNNVVSSLELRDVIFIGNSAAGGGGGFYAVTDDTPYTMVNVLFSGNLANLGGALYNQSGLDAGSRILTNVTMSGNRAELRGGAIDRPFDMTFRNAVIWNNRDQTGTGTPEATMDDFFSDSVVEVSNSLLQGYSANEFPDSSNNLDGTDPGNNPLFRDAVNPGGAPSLAGNLRLQQDSPVRDQGNNAFVTGIDTDLDGEARIFGGTVDLGPYEGTDLIFADGFEDSGF